MIQINDRLIICAYILCSATTAGLMVLIPIPWLLVLLLPPANLLALILAQVFTRWSFGE